MLVPELPEPELEEPEPVSVAPAELEFAKPGRNTGGRGAGARGTSAGGSGRASTGGRGTLCRSHHGGRGGGGLGGGILGRGSLGGRSLSDRGRCSSGGSAAGADSVGAGEFDRVGRTRHVRPGVGLGRVGVLDLDALDVHAEGSGIVVGLSTGPVDGSLAVAGVTTGPDTDAKVHGGLREARAALSIGIVESADDVAVDGPDEGLLGPVDGVLVESILRSGNCGPSVTVVSSGVTLSKVVGLNLAVVATKALLLILLAVVSLFIWKVTYPVNLIEVIGLQNNGADNTLARSSLHLYGDLTVEEVEVGLDGGGIALLVDSELGTIAASVDLASSGGPLVQATGLGEVELQVRLSATGVSGASLLGRVTVGVGLRGSEGGNGESRSNELHNGRHCEISCDEEEKTKVGEKGIKSAERESG